MWWAYEKGAQVGGFDEGFRLLVSFCFLHCRGGLSPICCHRVSLLLLRPVIWLEGLRRQGGLLFVTSEEMLKVSSTMTLLG